MALNFQEYKTKLYSAVLADTLDSLGYHKQTLSPGIKSIKPDVVICCLLYTSPSPRDVEESRMPSSA